MTLAAVVPADRAGAAAALRPGRVGRGGTPPGGRAGQAAGLLHGQGGPLRRRRARRRAAADGPRRHRARRGRAAGAGRDLARPDTVRGDHARPSSRRSSSPRPRCWPPSSRCWAWSASPWRPRCRPPRGGGARRRWSLLAQGALVMLSVAAVVQIVTLGRHPVVELRGAAGAAVRRDRRIGGGAGPHRDARAPVDAPYRGRAADCHRSSPPGDSSDARTSCSWCCPCCWRPRWRPSRPPRGRSPTTGGSPRPPRPSAPRRSTTPTPPPARLQWVTQQVDPEGQLPRGRRAAGAAHRRRWPGGAGRREPLRPGGGLGLAVGDLRRERGPGLADAARRASTRSGSAGRTSGWS